MQEDSAYKTFVQAWKKMPVELSPTVMLQTISDYGEAMWQKLWVHQNCMWLHLKTQWFEMIKTGEKTEEYRDMTPYWKNRLIHPDFPDGFYDGTFAPKKSFVIFVKGYDVTLDNICLKYIKQITIGKGKPEWGAPENKDVFRLELEDITKDTEIPGIDFEKLV